MVWRMPTSWFMAFRFMWEQRTQNALIVTGVGVGVAVLVFISALIGGLQASLIARTLGSQAHVVVTPLEQEGRPILPPQPHTTYLRRIEKPVQRVEHINEWQKVDANISALRAVTATVPVASGPAFALRGNASFSVVVLGAPPDRFDRVVAVRPNITRGHYSVAGNDVVLGIELASDLGVDVGDRVRLRTPTSDGQVFIVRGLVDMGSRALNGTWALVSLRNAQTLLNLAGAVTSVYAQVQEVYEAEAVSRNIGRLTGLTARSWMESNAQLLTALKSQTASTTMIRFFVIVSVAIGIASVLVVSVIQRSKEIGILRAMGAARAMILKVFLIQGAIVGLLGSIIGSALGAALSQLFRVLAQNPDGTPFFPFALDLQLFVASAAIATFAGVLAAVVPARRAAALDPAEAIRG